VNTWPNPQRPEPATQILELRHHLQLRITPLPPDTTAGHETGLLDVRLWRRTPNSILPGDFSATSSGFRVPQSRVTELITMIADAQSEALRLGVWPEDE
jgi:hypothetical protein